MSNDKPKLVKGITPKGCAVWPRLNTPDEYEGKKTYKSGLILSAEDAADLIDKIDTATADCLAATKEKLSDAVKNGKTGDIKAKAKKALAALETASPYTAAVDSDGEETGDVMFKFKSNADFKDGKTGKIKQIKVPLFDSKGKPTTVMIYGGSTIRVAYALVPYHMAATNKVGVSLRIEGIKVIEPAKSGGGYDANSLGFGEEEDGYESSGLEDDDSSDSSDDSDADPDEVTDF